MCNHGNTILSGLSVTIMLRLRSVKTVIMETQEKVGAVTNAVKNKFYQKKKCEGLQLRSQPDLNLK